MGAPQEHAERVTRVVYSPEYVEGRFRELRVDGVLGSFGAQEESKKRGPGAPRPARTPARPRSKRPRGAGLEPASPGVFKADILRSFPEGLHQESRAC